MTNHQTILSVALVLFGLLVNAQANSHAEKLPEFKDWFLSSGDWSYDAQIYVREFGAGKDTVIVLHGGWGGEHSGMITSVEALKKEYRFIFYDQRGSLRSPFPDSLITFSNHIDDLERLRAELKMKKVTLLAHSMGAVLASAYAEKYPKNIKKLILVAPAYLKNPVPKEDQQIQKNATINFQEFLNREEVIEELKKYKLLHENFPLSSKQRTAKFRIQFAKRMLYNIQNWTKLMGGRAIYQGHVFELTAKTYPKTGWDYFENFKRTTYPVDIIVGDHDFLDMGNKLIKKWSSNVATINLKIIEKAGHIVWLDQPLLFQDTIRASLQP